MTTLTPCLSPDALARLAAGRLPESDEDDANAHLCVCRDCAAAYEGFNDPLVAALRDGPEGPDAGPPSGLVRRLKALPLPASTVEQSRAAFEATPAVDLRAGPADRLDMLRPSRGDGELGWLGKFRVTGVLGKGGMGYVFRAEDTALGRAVALKVIRPPHGHPATGTQRERFLREARSAARLDHPHIVPVYEVGEAEGTPYLAMPLLRGRTLADELAEGGAVAPPRLLRLARQVAEGLAAAHDAGMVHRDIKPSNLWVGPGPDGECARVLDFGLAKDSEPAGGDLTGAGALVGTPAYMAPEQADLDPVTPRADLFSLGVVFYEMAAGRPLFTGKSNREILNAVRKFAPPPAAALLPGAGAFAAVVGVPEPVTACGSNPALARS